MLITLLIWLISQSHYKMQVAAATAAVPKLLTVFAKGMGDK